MKSLKFNIRPISCLGRPLRKMLLVLGPLRRTPSSIRQFFEKLMHNMEYGFAIKYTMDQFTQGVISRDEMLWHIDELEEKFQKKS